MYDTEELQELVSDYLQNVDKPSRKGLGHVLHTSGQTIGNVLRGEYNGKYYGKVPHINRVIDNKDFKIIREVFCNTE